jgi:hypothetical protein
MVHGKPGLAGHDYGGGDPHVVGHPELILNLAHEVDVPEPGGVRLQSLELGSFAEDHHLHGWLNLGIVLDRTSRVEQLADALLFVQASHVEEDDRVLPQPQLGAHLGGVDRHQLPVQRDLLPHVEGVPHHENSIGVHPGRE